VIADESARRYASHHITGIASMKKEPFVVKST